MNPDDQWNAMIETISGIDFHTENQSDNEAYLLFQYYSLMENGGHESLLNSFEEDIKGIGIEEIHLRKTPA